MLDQGMTCYCLAIKGTLILSFGLKGELRDEAARVVSALQQRNITAHIVSGDHSKAVEDVARSLGIHQEHTASRRLPGQKQQYVAALQARSNKIVMFCGDGTNDAVALAQADIGVQLGTASDVTGAVADVVLLGGLDGTLALLDISKRAFRRIMFNFAWSAAYNVFAILLASGAFVKFRVPPAYAGLGEIVSVVPAIIAAVSLLWGNVRTV
jgi:P-type E1-E2 ATPase